MATEEVKIAIRVNDDGTIGLFDKVGNKIEDLDSKIKGGGASSKQFFAGIKDGATDALGPLGSLATKGAAAAAGIALVAGAVKLFAGAARDAREIADEVKYLNEVSRDTGASRDYMMAYRTEIKAAGRDVHELGDAINTFQRVGLKQGEVLTALGVTTRDANKAVIEAAKAIQELPPGFEKASATAKLFGGVNDAVLTSLAATRVEAGSMASVINSELTVATDKWTAAEKALNIARQEMADKTSPAVLDALTEVSEAQLKFNNLTSDFYQASQANFWGSVADIVNAASTAYRGLAAAINLVRSLDPSGMLGEPTAPNYADPSAIPTPNPLTGSSPATIEARRRALAALSPEAKAAASAAASAAAAAAKEALQYQRGASEDAERQYEAQRKAYDLRADLAIDVAQRELDFAREHNATIETQLKLYGAVEAAELSMLDHKRKQLEVEIELGDMFGEQTGEMELQRAQWAVVKDAIAQSHERAAAFGEELRKAVQPAGAIAGMMGLVGESLLSSVQSYRGGGFGALASSFAQQLGGSVGTSGITGTAQAIYAQYTGGAVPAGGFGGFAKFGTPAVLAIPSTPPQYDSTGRPIPGTGSAGAPGIAAVAGGMTASGYAAIIAAVIGGIAESVKRVNDLERGVKMKPYGTGLITDDDLYLAASQGAHAGALGSVLGGSGTSLGNAIGRLTTGSLAGRLAWDQFMFPGAHWVLSKLLQAPTAEKQLATQVEEQFKQAGLLNAEGGSQTRGPGALARLDGWDVSRAQNGLLLRGPQGLFEVQNGRAVVPGRSAELNSMYGGLQAFARTTFGDGMAEGQSIPNNWVEAFLNRARQLGYSKEQTEADFLKFTHANQLSIESVIGKTTDDFVMAAALRGNANATGGFRAAADFTQGDYTDRIRKLAELFEKDLPIGVDASRVALDSMIDGNGKLVVSVEKFNRLLAVQAGIYDNLTQSLAGLSGSAMGDVFQSMFSGGSSVGARNNLGTGIRELDFGTVQSLAVAALQETSEFKELNANIAKLVKGDSSGLGGVAAGLNFVTGFAGRSKSALDLIGYAFLGETLGDIGAGATSAAFSARQSLLSPRKQRGALLGQIGGVDSQIAALLADGVIDPLSEGSLFASLLGQKGSLAGQIGALGGKKNVQLSASIYDQVAVDAKKGRDLVSEQNRWLSKVNISLEALTAALRDPKLFAELTVASRHGGVVRSGPTSIAGIRNDRRTTAEIRNRMR